jgi:hypothetical protein
MLATIAGPLSYLHRALSAGHRVSTGKVWTEGRDEFEGEVEQESSWRSLPDWTG